VPLGRDQHNWPAASNDWVAVPTVVGLSAASVV
jgi:hypothetical protein